jgi:hypothetical protein
MHRGAVFFGNSAKRYGAYRVSDLILGDVMKMTKAMVMNSGGLFGAFKVSDLELLGSQRLCLLIFRQVE